MLRNELIVRLCCHDRERQVTELDYLVNSIVMTIGIPKEDIQKKLAAMGNYKQRYVENLYMDKYNPNYEKAKEKIQTSESDIVKKVAGLGGSVTKPGTK
jgi:hypothetical protein